MFYRCSSLKEIKLSNFNTNNVTNMNGMFSKCPIELKSKILEEYETFYDVAFK